MLKRIGRADDRKFPRCQGSGNLVLVQKHAWRACLATTDERARDTGIAEEPLGSRAIDFAVSA